MPLPLLVTFVAGASGAWRIDRLATVIGDGLPAAERLAVLEGPEAPTQTEAGWVLRGVTSNTRYTNLPRLTLWSPAKKDFLVRKRREPRLFQFARQRHGGLQALLDPGGIRDIASADPEGIGRAGGALLGGPEIALGETICCAE